MEILVMADGRPWSIDSQRMSPLDRLIADRAAVHEIGLTFEFVYGNKGHERFSLIRDWMLNNLKEKYSNRWPELLDAFCETPESGRLAAKMELEELANGA